MKCSVILYFSTILFQIIPAIGNFKVPNFYGDLMKFSIEVNKFIATDIQHINVSPYLAFNNSPVHYVDLNGKAPLSAADIFKSQFGEDRVDVYEAFDRNMTSMVSTLQINDYFLTSLVNIESNIDHLLEQHIPDGYPKALRKLLKSVYRQSTREINEFSQRVAIRRNRGSQAANRQSQGYRIERTYKYRVKYKPTTLKEESAQAFWENSGIGRSIYEKEVVMWNEMNERLHKEKKQLLGDNAYRLNTDLTPEELSTLYENDFYKHSANLRARINCTQGHIDISGSRTMRGTPFGYYNMNRGQFVNFNRRDGMLTPFRPIVEMP